MLFLVQVETVPSRVPFAQHVKPFGRLLSRQREKKRASEGRFGVESAVLQLYVAEPGREKLEEKKRASARGVQSHACAAGDADRDVKIMARDFEAE